MTDSFLKQLRDKKLHGITPLQLKKERLTPLNELTESAQKEVNLFVRNRDKDKGCICCGSEVFDAAHFIAIGVNTAVRFEESNLNGCCVTCNRYKGGNLKVYRIELIKKVGIDEVLRLENYKKFWKWSREQLENLIEHYTELNKKHVEVE